MGAETALTLDSWANFYIIIGSSAAALTGLMFIVISLSAGSRAIRNSDASNAFATPTVVHYCVVLLIAALMTAPGHTATSLAVCLATICFGGLGYMVWSTLRIIRQSAYAPVAEDWVWHVVLPTLAYAALAAVVAEFRWRSDRALEMLAASVMLLLFVGIHNAWDAAVWIAARAMNSAPAESPPPPSAEPGEEPVRRRRRRR